MHDARLTESHCPARPAGPVRDTTVGWVLRATAALTPDATALDEADALGALHRRWSYAQLAAECERLARALASRYAPGERICVWAPNIPEWLMLEFAAAEAGLILVTANPAYQARELDFVLRQSRSVGLFLTPEHRGNPMAQIAARVAAELPALREVVDMTDPEALFAQPSPVAALPAVGPDDPAQIQYTSGTTGFPKGAVLTHRGLTNNARLIFERGEMTPDWTVLNCMPMFHTAGCSINTLGPVQFGCRIILARQFDGSRMNALIEAERVDTLMCVPTMLTAMLEAQAAHRRDVSSVKLAISGGSMVQPELVRRVRQEYGCDFQTVYGQTEACPVITQSSADDSPEDVCETVGRPLPHTEVSIRDPQTGQVAPLGAVGEICARGYCVMLEYNDNPEGTAGALDAEGWLHTGDLGTMDERGYVRVTGRVKDMIIRGGENLFPAEIEAVLLEHPDVAEVAVVGVPDALMGEIVACFVRLSAGAALDPPTLVRHCRAQLSPQKTPAHWIAVTEWPLTGSGKIQKFVLRDRYVAGEWTG